MIILYGILSQGQGHINRAAVLVRRLRARGHRVDVVLSGDPPPSYAQHVLGGAFELIEVPNLVLANGVLARRKTMQTFARSLPQRLREVHGLARRLVRERIDLVLTDFEPISAWSARRVGVPVIGISGQYRITRTNACAAPHVGRAERLFAKVVMEAWTPPLTRYFAVSFVSDDSATRARTSVVSPIVDERLLERTPRQRGFYLAYLYSYEQRAVVDALKDHGVPFRVYGLGARGTLGNLTFCATDREGFANDLLGCEGVILNGSFQGVCEAAALKKRILSVPFQGQYEEHFNAYQLERAGLGLSANGLSRDAIKRLLAFSFPPKSRAARLSDGAVETMNALGL